MCVIAGMIEKQISMLNKVLTGPQSTAIMLLGQTKSNSTWIKRITLHLA